MPRQSKPPSHLRGAILVHDPAYNKGGAFTVAERLRLRVHGLVPPAVASIELQLRLVLETLRGKHSDLERYIYLMALQQRDETLFYRVLMDQLTHIMPLGADARTALTLCG
eukprot:Unigene11452_Nuclearia_a/m.34921 Unigene11452_Nuclearia_a/g.34921  ORF Unigene11452_Nuclearia_a/g.34921 Unigene11452_Nuclearia_a/m.34921 type:complete len:111 (+) Unigene11452_Nuclearia_a:31-363(+)